MLMFSMNKYLQVFTSHFLLFLESALSVLLLFQLRPASVEILVPLGLSSHPSSPASHHKPTQADTEIEQVYLVFRLQFPVDPSNYSVFPHEGFLHRRQRPGSSILTLRFDYDNITFLRLNFAHFMC